MEIPHRVTIRKKTSIDRLKDQIRISDPNIDFDDYYSDVNTEARNIIKTFKMGSLTKTYWHRQTILFEAALYGKTWIVDALISREFQIRKKEHSLLINHQDDRGNTCLHAVIENTFFRVYENNVQLNILMDPNRSMTMAMVLLGHTADPNLQNIHGETVLHLAIRGGIFHEIPSFTSLKSEDSSVDDDLKHQLIDTLIEKTSHKILDKERATPILLVARLYHDEEPLTLYSYLEHFFVHFVEAEYYLTTVPFVNEILKSVDKALIFIGYLCFVYQHIDDFQELLTSPSILSVFDFTKHHKTVPEYLIFVTTFWKWFNDIFPGQIKVNDNWALFQQINAIKMKFIQRLNTSQPMKPDTLTGKQLPQPTSMKEQPSVKYDQIFAGPPSSQPLTPPQRYGTLNEHPMFQRRRESQGGTVKKRDKRVRPYI